MMTDEPMTLIHGINLYTLVTLLLIPEGVTVTADLCIRIQRTMSLESMQDQLQSAHLKIL